jgi:hypothetical protein
MNLPTKRCATTPPRTAATLESAICPLVRLRSFVIEVITAAGANDDQIATMKPNQARWKASVCAVALPQKARFIERDLPSES